MSLLSQEKPLHRRQVSPSLTTARHSLERYASHPPSQTNTLVKIYDDSFTNLAFCQKRWVRSDSHWFTLPSGIFLERNSNGKLLLHPHKLQPYHLLESPGFFYYHSIIFHEIVCIYWSLPCTTGLFMMKLFCLVFYSRRVVLSYFLIEERKLLLCTRVVRKSGFAKSAPFLRIIHRENGHWCNLSKLDRWERQTFVCVFAFFSGVAGVVR